MSSKTLCLSVPPSILGHECVSGKACEVMVMVGGGGGGGVGVYLQWTGFPSRERSCTPGGFIPLGEVQVQTLLLPWLNWLLKSFYRNILNHRNFTCSDLPKR